MYAQVEKPKENKSRAVANFVAQKKGNVKQGLKFVDNRPEAKAQNSLQLMINSVHKMAGVVQLLASSDLKDEDIVKAGSPATYKVGNWFVKKWTNNGSQKSQTMLDNWKTADEVVYTPDYKREKLTDVNDYVFSSKKCKGDVFFQHSKPGKKAVLENWLDKGHDTKRLKELSSMFRAAKMGDPQGFFQDKVNGVFEFMDIQVMGAGQMGGYADYIDAKFD